MVAVVAAAAVVVVKDQEYNQRYPLNQRDRHKQKDWQIREKEWKS
jgi:hypothetical protein